MKPVSAPAPLLIPAQTFPGGVGIGEGALVGTGAQVLQYLHIGAGATVGAGAVVTRNVPEGLTVVGVPARPQSADRTPSEVQQLR